MQGEDMKRKVILDEEEKEILKSVHRGEFKRIKNFEERKKQLEYAAYKHGMVKK